MWTEYVQLPGRFTSYSRRIENYGVDTLIAALQLMHGFKKKKKKNIQEAIQKA